MDIIKALENNYELRTIGLNLSGSGLVTSIAETFREDFLFIPITYKFSIQTGTGVANRTCTLKIEHNKHDIVGISSTQNQTASTLHEYYFGSFGSAETFGNLIHTLPIPQIVLQQNTKVKFDIVSAQAGDDIIRASIFGLMKNE